MSNKKVGNWSDLALFHSKGLRTVLGKKDVLKLCREHSTDIRNNLGLVVCQKYLDIRPLMDWFKTRFRVHISYSNKTVLFKDSGSRIYFDFKDEPNYHSLNLGWYAIIDFCEQDSTLSENLSHRLRRKVEDYKNVAKAQ